MISFGILYKLNQESSMKRILIIVLLFSGMGSLHSFGKNKVTYHEYKWYLMETEHFRLYVTENDRAMSNLIITTAENIYEKHALTFDYRPLQKIKVMIYPNQLDFQQNNVAQDMIGPGTGGFTEFVKGRVVLPYSTDYYNFEHILSHELTHAFQGHTWGRGNFGITALMDINVPLWFIEGMAEYASIGLDYESEMMISDALYYGHLPSLMQLSYLDQLDPRYYFFVYKEGQMFYYFAEQKYGPDILPRINHSISSNRSLQQVLTNVFKKDLEAINDEFFDFLKARYLPVSIGLDNVSAKASRLLNKDSHFNMNPVYLDSKRVAFISDRMLYPSIVIADKSSGRLARLLKGGFTENYLEFHYGKRNNLSVSGTNILCFVSRSGGKDVIQIMNVYTRKVEGLDLPFREIHSPQISPDGFRVLFAASRDQQVDIYIYDRTTQDLKQVTDDPYFDTQPRWISPDRIVFATTRYQGSESGDKDLLIYDIPAQAALTVIDSGYNDEYPAVSGDGKWIAFTSVDDHPGLYVYDITTGVVYQELIPRGGIMSPSFGMDHKLVFTLYRDNDFNIYEYKAVLTNRVTTVKVTDAGTMTVAPEPVFGRTLLRAPELYRLEMTVDNLIGAFALNTSLQGMALIGIMDMSDLLGDHRLRVILDSQIQLQTNFFDYINADITYLNVKHRLNFGFRLFNFSNYFYEFHTFESFTLLDRNYAWSAGGFATASYPFSTFSRLDLTLGVRAYKYIDNVTQVGTNYVFDYSYQNRETLALNYVYDATLWDVTGPVDGIRLDLSLEKSFALFDYAIDYTRLLFDYRQYIMLFPHYSLAFRAVVGKSFGPDRMEFPLTVGGFNSIRGYDLFAFNGDNMYLLNLEFRFPLIIDWTIGFPIPLRLPTIWGVLFCDFGSAWMSDQPYQLWYRQNDILIFDDLKAGLGMGFRLVLLPGIKLMVDLATTYDGRGVAPLADWRSFWQIGVDF